MSSFPALKGSNYLGKFPHALVVDAFFTMMEGEYNPVMLLEVKTPHQTILKAI